MKTQSKEQFIHSLWINQKEGKIDIYLNVMERKLIFRGLRKVKLNGMTAFHILGEKEYALGDGELNFEKVCTAVYRQMEENHTLIEGVQAFLAETTQIEIKTEEEESEGYS